MSLIVEVYVNQTLIARAVARNQSSLADLSDYIVTAVDYPSEFNNYQQTRVEGEVKQHNRNQPAWALIKKMMEVILK